MRIESIGWPEIEQLDQNLHRPYQESRLGISRRQHAKGVSLYTELKHKGVFEGRTKPSESLGKVATILTEKFAQLESKLSFT